MAHYWKLELFGDHCLFQYIFVILKLCLCVYLSICVCYLFYLCFVCSLPSEYRSATFTPLHVVEMSLGSCIPRTSVCVIFVVLCHWPHSRSPALGRVARGVIALTGLTVSLLAQRAGRAGVCWSLRVPQLSRFTSSLLCVYRCVVFFGLGPLVEHSETCLNVRALFHIICMIISRFRH